MTLREKLQALLKEAADLVAKAREENREFTEDEVARITELKKESDEVEAKVQAADAAQAAAAAMAGKASVQPGTPPAGPAGALQVKDRQETADAATLGERFVKSSLYGEFRKQHPTGLGQGSAVDIGRIKVGTMKEWLGGRKATASPLQVALGHVQPVRMPMVDQVDRDNLTILDLVTRGEASGPFEYLQVTGVTRNAAIVPDEILPGDATVKPTSTIQTELADAKPYTYADGYDVTNALLSDAPALATYMNNELEYSLDSVIEDKLLNGTGASGEPKGILHTTGVQELTYSPGPDAMAQVKAIRQAITKITTLPGGNVTACLMSPEDDEAWDLLQDTTDRFMGQGPFGQGPSTSWGRARALSQRLSPGTVILGDWRQVALLDVEGLSILAFNQHKDYAQRNLVYVRAELRAEQVIWKPNRLIVVKPAGGGS
ncbi:putative phage major capsid protein [Streptomyces scabiei 87.22]|uniref:Putative phage major capsid protein n=1 Tax=Streptomyces scabiei (strain 87.22) TaxID=680198 RepID=C9ZE63_STRSW|nr:phage major capsid protein [Streptomyces scabiei]MBP5931908.1 phage major capsid protein [Streptomyces sp. LBUM 1479]MDX3048971.1 phage major capsid protein [Streptomyces scabiei]MDX3078703.1 phage major capsid protein [Streptomyces scabiei]MDX3174362.1 phage major capsid protein [Streptomyces scabiei]MDX3271226.1 phage major capsid protein [Streptomyces scabiei]